MNDGVAMVLAEGTGAIITISVDKFSSYFVIYSDTQKEKDKVAYRIII